ncbi:MAG: hypothetical protein KC912_09905 [Proteobacteria bacterium]|nr:hypothetical protein [Pseudomonadota bacterium]
MLLLFSIAALAAEPLGLTLDLSHDVVLVDGREQLHATAIFDDGTTKRLYSGLDWSSSSSDVLEISRDGVAAGLEVGSVQVEAVWGGLKSAPLTVEVIDSGPKRLHIEPVSVEIMPGVSASLELIATFEDGRKADATRLADWTARYSDVAQVEAGRVTGMVEGETSVTASWRGTRAPSASVRVNVPKAVGLTVDPPVEVLVVGGRVNLAAHAVFQTGHSLDVSKRVRWESTAPDVLQVDGAGRLTALRAGTAIISTSWEHLEPSPLRVEVIGGDVKKLRVKQGNRSVAAGDGLTLHVEGLVGSRWVDLTHAAEWISSDARVLLAGQGGLVTGVGRGRVKLTAQYGALADAVEVVVTP